MGFFEELGDSILSIGGGVTQIGLGLWIVGGIIVAILIAVLLILC